MTNCPKCDSKKIQTIGKMFWFILLFATGGTFIWFGIFFPLFFFLSALFIIISPIAFVIPKVNQCRECKHSWKPNKKVTA